MEEEPLFTEEVCCELGNGSEQFTLPMIQQRNLHQSEICDKSQQNKFFLPTHSHETLQMM